MATKTVHVDHIARIEGHGNVHVVIEGDQVKTVEMDVVEPARLFESMVRGRSFTEVSYISSRICGICSASHVVTDLLAIERIFGIKVTDRVNALRFDDVNKLMAEVLTAPHAIALVGKNIDTIAGKL